MQRWRRPQAGPPISPHPATVRSFSAVSIIGLPIAVGTLLSIAILACGIARAADAEPSRPPLAVVELFTSQGCSSCPPADALIGELARREDVLALSEHVDYWDYLGWKDPFASPAHTARQREYARALGLKYVYTPQIVVQGQAQVAGNERDAVLRAIAAQERTQPSVRVSWADADQLVVGVDSPASTATADVWLVLYDRSHTTRIERGENSGRALANYNVVRSFRRIARWQGEPVQVVVDLRGEDWTARGCAVILQSESTGPIVDAAACTPPRN